MMLMMRMVMMVMTMMAVLVMIMMLTVMIQKHVWCYAYLNTKFMWVVVKIMVPFWIPIIIRQLIFGVPKKGP